MCNQIVKIRTVTKPRLIERNTTLDLSLYKNGINSFSVKNIGATNATLYNFLEVAAGDPLISFLGFTGEIKTDLVDIKFVGGTGKLVVFLNQYAE